MLVPTLCSVCDELVVRGGDGFILYCGCWGEEMDSFFIVDAGGEEMASYFIVYAGGRRWLHSLLWMLRGGDGFILYCGC